jgi:hypothetical protein
VGNDEGDSDAVVVTCDRPIDEAALRASESIDSSIKPSDECQTYSDHQHRWAAGLPAVLMIDSTEYDGYPSYHEPCQTVKR